jgi:hypothetical protein
LFGCGKKNSATETGQVKEVCLISDSNGNQLASDSFIVFPMGIECKTDAEGKFTISYEQPDDERGLLIYVRHKEPDLIGSGWLPKSGGEVQIKLAKAATASGQVTDPNGKPLAGVQVAALPMSNRFVLTDSEGRFDIAWDPVWGPPEGLCLMARHTGLNLACVVDITAEMKNYEIKLAPALTLGGTVTDINDNPIAGAKVGISLRKSSWGCGTPVEPVVTDKQGRYEFRALPQQQEYINYANAEGYSEGVIRTGISNKITGRDDVEQIILEKIE